MCACSAVVVRASSPSIVIFDFCNGVEGVIDGDWVNQKDQSLLHAAVIGGELVHWICPSGGYCSCVTGNAKLCQLVMKQYKCRWGALLVRWILFLRVVS